VAPTVFPTYQPTEQTSSIVLVTSYFVLKNLGTTNLTINEQLAVRRTQASIVNVPLERVIYVRTRSTVPLRQSRSQSRNLQDLNQLVAETSTTLQMVDYPEYEGNTTALYSSVTSAITDSLNTGVFTDVLKEQAVQVNATIFVTTNFTTTNVTFTEPTIQFPPSRRPTSMPRYSDGLSNGEVAAFVVITVVCSGLLVYLVYLVITNFRRQKPASKDDKELFMDGAFEKLDLPDNDDVMIINVGASLDDIQFNNNIQIYQRDVDSRL
jgi:hypothetical protein